MNNFQELVQQGSLHAWFYIPTAILLGALHGLEPGHSKTMMAAFIVAVRGTFFQAVLLGLCAAFSHSLVIWLLAVIALYYGNQFNAESSEPYFQLITAVIILVLALWMAWKTYQDVRAEAAHGHDHDHHDHDHDAGPYHHHGESFVIQTGHELLKLSIFEEDVPPVFRLHYLEHGREIPPPAGQTVTLETIRSDGYTQRFTFTPRQNYLESVEVIPEPHEFVVSLQLAHGDHAHTYSVEFKEGQAPISDSTPAEYQDAHELAHAMEIQQRFANRQVTTGQIALFGLTGGLLPCPAAFTIVLLCLQLKKFALGIFMVLAFSTGLALTLVATGALAAWSLRHAEKRFGGLGKIARKLPYLSSALLIAMAGYVGFQGWTHLGK